MANIDFLTNYRWVATQRSNYKDPKKRDRLTPDRLAKLEAIEFELNPTELWAREDAPAQEEAFVGKSLKERTDEFFRQLRAYKEQHGHINVKYHEGKLGSWLSRMKYNFQCGTIDDDVFLELDKMGVDWESSHENRWESMYEELAAFYEEHGHCDVKHDDEELHALYRWCNKQRLYYKTDGKLSEDKICKLEKLKFQWESTNKRKRISTGARTPVKTHLERAQMHMEKLRAIKEAKAAKKEKDAAKSDGG